MNQESDLPADERRPRHPFLLGQIPDPVLFRLGRQVALRLALRLGHTIGGDCATIWANAVGGESRTEPRGIATVECNGTAWSIHTVESSDPFTQSQVHVPSGHISLYSMGMYNADADATDIARGVLANWNQRINAAAGRYTDLRSATLISNLESQKFVVCEERAKRIDWRDYDWMFGLHYGLVGHDKTSGRQCFTWSPESNEFVVVRQIPASARRFRIEPDVPHVSQHLVLDQIGFSPDWIVHYDTLG